MFEVGNVLLFKPFVFKNGAMPKDKFMIVLGKEGSGNLILASLPTSKDHIPNNIIQESGCVELPDKRINVFIFRANEVISTNAFSFNVNTYIYGANLDTYPIATFQEQITEKIINIQLIGKLTDVHYNSLKECLKNSQMVKNKFKRIL